ncbi:MAG: hypothetical protein AB1813_11580 [Verrucomicrobiota bacterium]
MSAGTKMERTDRTVSVADAGIFRLAMAWELEALALDAVRYQSQTQSERDTLRDCASVYRKCAAELTARLKLVQL